MNRKLRMGMIGGGIDAFIGAIHRTAAWLDGGIELVSGAFSSDPNKSRDSGRALHINQERVYGNFEEMIIGEKNLPADRRMDFVSIVTPNHFHFEPAKRALENGFHVILDKPMTFNLDEARELKRVVEETNLLLAVTHTYTGYPMVKEARSFISQGKLGKIRKVHVEYSQGWLATFLEKTGQKQASWRTDPAKSGVGGAIGDIGTHAANLAEYVTGKKILEVCAMLNIVVEGRLLDDDSSMLLKLEEGVTGSLIATQIAAGEENSLSIRVYGEKGGLEWCQEEPNSLEIKWIDKPREIYRAGWDYLSPEAKNNFRTPAGHPEGYLEAFANIYTSFSSAVHQFNNNKKTEMRNYDFADVDDGLRGLAFIETVIKSAKSNQKWTELVV